MPCSVELPAGCGKTELIASVTKAAADADRRSLVLTHTHAGVDALRRRLRRVGVPTASVNVRTLDSWCFDLIRSFPMLSGIVVGDEPEWQLSRDYHGSGARATTSVAVQR